MASIQRFAEITQAFDPEATRTLGQAFDMACARECEIVMTAGPKSPIPTLPEVLQGRTRTLLREAEQFVGSKYVDQVLDSLYVIEKAAQHFFIRAEMGKNAGRRAEEVDEDYKQAATLAALAAPYRHARLSAMKLAGGTNNNPVRFKDDATADELREEIIRRLWVLHEAGVIDLKALPVPGGGIAKQGAPNSRQCNLPVDRCSQPHEGQAGRGAAARSRRRSRAL
jgi:hypothetical protein